MWNQNSLELHHNFSEFGEVSWKFACRDRCSLNILLIVAAENRMLPNFNCCRNHSSNLAFQSFVELPQQSCNSSNCVKVLAQHILCPHLLNVLIQWVSSYTMVMWRFVATGISERLERLQYSLCMITSVNIARFELSRSILLTIHITPTKGKSQH